MKGQFIGGVYQDIQADRPDISIKRLRNAAASACGLVTDRKVLKEAVILLAPHVPAAKLVESTPGERLAEINRAKRIADGVVKKRKDNRSKQKEKSAVGN